MTDMIFFIGFYGLAAVVVIAVAVVSIVFIDKRYRKNHGQVIPKGYVRTEEVNIDPKTNKKLRVYYNEKTGDRFYHEEDDEFPTRR